MKKMLFVLSLLALGGWSLPEAHNQANKTLVEVGDWCSGTIIDKEKGYIVTANHCIEPVIIRHNARVVRPDGNEIYVNWISHAQFFVTQRKINEEGFEIGFSSYKVRVIGYNKWNDVAILENISTVPFQDDVKLSKVPTRFGDVVYTIGNPLMLHGAVGVGTVVHPRVFMPSLSTSTLILTNAPIDHGSSGGGLFNESGDLVGITNWKNPNGFETLSSPIINVINLLKEI